MAFLFPYIRVKYILMMRKKLLLISVALFFFNGVNAQNASGFSTEKLLEFNTYIQDEIDVENIAGAEVQVSCIGDGYFRTHFFYRPYSKFDCYFHDTKTTPRG